MKNKDLAVIAFIVILAGLLAYLWLAPAGQPKAPDVQFTDIYGQSFSLKQLKGKPVMVNFWATECPGCVNEIPLLVDTYQQYKAQELVIIGVAMGYDPESQVREMVQQKNMSYPIVLDSDDKLVQAFAVKVTPTTIFINKNGLIMKRKLGEMSHSDLTSTVKALLL